MNFFKLLQNKIKKKNLRVAVVGVGYVGFPLSLNISRKFNVIGFDLSKKRIQSLVKKKEVKANKKLLLTSNIKNLKNIDIFLICVPTPLKNNNDPDLSYVENAFLSINKFIKPGQAICLESTSYPGTTREIISNKIEKLRFKLGKDFFIGFSSEREDPGNKEFKLSEITKVFSGHTNSCSKIFKLFYGSIFKKIHYAKTLEIAEMSKLLENIYRSVNIGLVNEMKKICTKMNIDIFDVIKSAATKNFGFSVFWPGPGMGGHCIPIDPFYLTWKAKEFGAKSRFIELAGEINSDMPLWVFNRVQEILNKKKIHLSNAKVLLLGTAYKKNIGDVRGSPAIKIIDLLLRNNAKVFFNDNYVKVLNIKHKNFSTKSINYKNNKLKNFDLVILITDHSYYDKNYIIKQSKIIFDTRFFFNDDDKVSRC